MRDFQIPGRSPVLSTNAMVATSHPLAALEALNVLKDGGNAADAAIAGAVILGVCEPQMTGLGGDCFALVKPAGSNDVIALNGSGRAPAGLSAEALRAEGLTRIDAGHPASITVPGAVDAFCQLIRQDAVQHDWLQLSLQTQRVCDALLKSARTKTTVVVSGLNS